MQAVLKDPDHLCRPKFSIHLSLVPLTYFSTEQFGVVSIFITDPFLDYDGKNSC